MVLLLVEWLCVKRHRVMLRIFEMINVNDKSDLDVIFCLLYWWL